MLLCCRPARDCIQKRSLAHAKRIRSPLRLIAFPGTLHIHEFPYMALKVPVKRFSGQDAATSLVKLHGLCVKMCSSHAMKMPTPVVSLLWQAGTHVSNFAEKGEVNFKNLRCGEKQNTKTKGQFHGNGITSQMDILLTANCNSRSWIIVMSNSDTFISLLEPNNFTNSTCNFC